MKFRSDFVTNSSSSSFTVTVIIEDKNHNRYTFTEAPDEGMNADGWCGLNVDIRDLPVKALVERINKKQDTPIHLDGCDKQGRNGNIDKLSKGDILQLVIQPDGKVEVCSTDGCIGELPREAVRELRPALIGDGVDLKVKVAAAKPAMVNNGRKMRASVDITIAAAERDPSQKLLIGDVEELARFLMSQVVDAEGPDEDELEEFREIYEDKFGEECEDFYQMIKDRKEAFVKSVVENIRSLDDLAKIIEQRDYIAEGEFADPVAENDDELLEWAERVLNSEGEEREKALDGMFEYMTTLSYDRVLQEFGKGLGIRYRWKGGRGALVKLAENIRRGFIFGPYTGVEHIEVDLENGTTDAYAEFDI